MKNSLTEEENNTDEHFANEGANCGLFEKELTQYKYELALSLDEEPGIICPPKIMTPRERRSTNIDYKMLQIKDYP